MPEKDTFRPYCSYLAWASCASVEFFPRPQGDPCFDLWAFGRLNRNRCPRSVFGENALILCFNQDQKATVMRAQARWNAEQKAVVFRGYCLQQDGSIRF